jgi:hypothetical protein
VGCFLILTRRFTRAIHDKVGQWLHAFSVCNQFNKTFDNIRSLEAGGGAMFY